MVKSLATEDMMRTVKVLIIFLLVMVYTADKLLAEELSIYEVQYTTDPDGVSPQNGNVIDCSGGIVTHIFTGWRTRLILYDPDYPNGWGAIMAKDLYSLGAFNGVNIGDWVSFTNVEVEDFRGTTILQYISANDPNLFIESSDNPIPAPKVVSIEQIPAPIEGIDSWTVKNHDCEKYESMLVKIVDVTVADLGYGKAYDNYVLQSNADPNHTCWASDYMNVDLSAIYHPYIQVGQTFCGVTGIFEQYNGESDGIYFDYYQLLTLSTDSFLVEQTADLDEDCDVDLADYMDFAAQWLQSACIEPDWCGGADLTGNGSVDVIDLQVFADNWLESKLL